MDTTNDIVSRVTEMSVAEDVSSLTAPSVGIIRNPDINTPEWRFRQLMGQKRLAFQLTFDSGVADKGLYRYVHDSETFLQAFRSYAAGLDVGWLRLFQAYRWKPILTFEITSSAQHVGLLCLYYSPCPLQLRRYFRKCAITPTGAEPDPGPEDREDLPRHVWWQLPNKKFIGLGHNGNYVATLPWSSSQSALVLMKSFVQSASAEAWQDYDEQGMGELVLTTVVPLAKVTGVSSVAQVRIWIEYELDVLSLYSPFASAPQMGSFINWV